MHSAHAAAEHDDLRADMHAIVEVDHVLIDESDAARGDAGADALGLIGAVDAIERIAGALVEIHRSRTERVVEPARHALGEFFELGLARDHLRWWRPGRPLRFAPHLRDAAPAEAFAPDADAITCGAPAAPHIEEMAARRIDDDGARPLMASIGHFLAQEGGIDLRGVDGGDLIAVILH